MAVSDDAMQLELSVTERQLIEQMFRIEKRVNQSARKIEGDFQKQQQKLGGNIDKMNKDVERSFNRTVNSAGAAGKMLVASLASAGIAFSLERIATGTARAIEGVAQLGDEARRAGVSARAFQEWRFVAEQNRIGVDQLVDGLKELNLRADEFVETGGGSAAEAFERLGFGASDLKKRLEDPSELLLEIIGRLGNLDTAAQIRVADEVFGGSAGERFVELIAQGEDGLRNTVNRARDLGLVLDDDVIEKAQELDRKFKEIQATIANFGKRMAVGFAEGIQQIIVDKNKLEQVFGSDTAAESAVGPGAFEALQGASSVPDDVAAVLDDLRQTYTELLSIVRATSNAIAMEVPTLLDAGYSDLALQLSDTVDEMTQLSSGFNQGEIDARDFGEGMKAATESAESLLTEASAINGVSVDDAVSSVGRLSGALEGALNMAMRLRQNLPGATPQDEGIMPSGPPRRVGHRAGTPGLAPSTSIRPQLPGIDASFGTPDPKKSGRGGAGSASDYQRAIESIRERTAALEAESAALLMVAAAGSEYSSAIEVARREAELLVAAQKDGQAITPQLRAEVRALAEAYGAAADGAKAAEDQLRLLEERADLGREAMVDLFMGIMDGAEGARNALGNLLLRIAEVQATNAITDFLGGGSGLGSFLGGLLKPRARGGPVQQGQPYLVNENTPRSELFVPSQSGAILNVSQAQQALRGSAGGGGVVRIEVVESGGFAARVNVMAQGVATQVYRANEPGTVATALGQIAESQREPGF